MSYGEGYELFMCPNCESNLYEPGPACMRCGYSASAWLDLNPDPARKYRYDPQNPSLLQAARRDTKANESRVTMQLIHSMPEQRRRAFITWADIVIKVTARIAQYPISLSTEDDMAALRRIFQLLPTRPVTEEALEELYQASRAFIELVEGQRPPGLPAEQHRRQRSTFHRWRGNPLPGYEIVEAPTPADGLTTAERTVVGGLETALRARASLDWTGQRFTKPEGILIAKLQFLPGSKKGALSRSVDRELTPTVTWNGPWRRYKPNGNQRHFVIEERHYTLVLMFSYFNAFLIRLDVLED